MRQWSTISIHGDSIECHLVINEFNNFQHYLQVFKFLFLIVKCFRMIVDLNGTDNGKQKMFTTEGKLRS